MKTILITAPNSGSGKTTVTMGILRALHKQGLDICAFKTGPDYIDRAFLERAGRCPAGNLDMHLQGRAGLRRAFSMLKAEYCVIEGAMGYFDGVYNTCQNSSYDIARMLNVPAVLIYTPKGEMFTAVPKIKGMAEFKASAIKAVIFNNVSERQYQMLKEAVEEHTSLKVLGYLPKLKDAELQSRHLGLVQSMELEDLEAKIDAVAEQLKDSVDMEALIGLMQELETQETPLFDKRGIRVAIAKDEAFSFYYSENIRLLEACCEVVYFSPLKDSCIPACDLLYLGGGYPELHKENLSSNDLMLESIRAFHGGGGHIYAECGGFMYLTDSIDGLPMVGIFKGHSKMTGSLQNFGYIKAEIKEDCLLGRKGAVITAHEFHKSLSQVEAIPVLGISKLMGGASWEGGYIQNNAYGGYPHISFIGNMEVFYSIMDHIERGRNT